MKRFTDLSTEIYRSESVISLTEEAKERSLQSIGFLGIETEVVTCASNRIILHLP
jgi:hypothetical protein